MNTNDILGLFNSLGNVVGSADPDTGQGALGEWPPEGDHQCIIVGVDVSPSTFKRKPDDLKLPTVEVRFRYRLVTDPTRPSPLEWKGKPVRLLDPSQLQDSGQRQNIEIGAKRLQGFIFSILGRTAVGNGGAEVKEIADLIEKADSAIVCVIRANYRQYESKKGKQYEDREDFCVSRVG